MFALLSHKRALQLLSVLLLELLLPLSYCTIPNRLVLERSIAGITEVRLSLIGVHLGELQGIDRGSGDYGSGD